MEFIKTDFEGLYLIEHKLIEDNRGWFMRTFDLQIFQNMYLIYHLVFGLV